MSMETKRKTGLTDEIRVEDGSGNDVFNDVEVNISSASHEVELPSELISSIGEGAGFIARQDGPISVTGDLSIRAIDLSVLRLMGDYTEDSGAGTWTVTSKDVLPEWSFKQQVTETAAITLSGYDSSGTEPAPAKGFKFDEYTLNVSKDETVTVDFSGIGLYAELVEETITTNNSVLKPENWLDAHVEVDGTQIGSLDSVEVSVTRGAEAVRGIEQRDTNFRKLPSQVVEGMREVSFSMTVEVTDKQAWEEVFGETGTTIQPVDEKSEKQIDVVTETAGTLTVNSAVVENVSGDLEDDSEVRTVDIDGNARDWTASGQL